MGKNLRKSCNYEDIIENLRSILDKNADSIIQHNITEEIMLISEELDKLIVNYYKFN